MEESEQGLDQRIAAEAMKRPLEQRTVYLDRTCGVASELRERVHMIMEGILGNLGAVSALWHEPTTADREAPGASERPGCVIGNYKLLQPIGEGGFGSVYMAEQLHPVRRKVALKIIKLGMDTRQVIARFEAERQAGDDGSSQHRQGAGCGGDGDGAAIFRDGAGPWGAHQRLLRQE